MLDTVPGTDVFKSAQFAMSFRFATVSCPTCIKQVEYLRSEYIALQSLLERCAPDFNMSLPSDEANRSVQFQNLVIFG